MAGILDLLSGESGKQILNGVSKEAGITENQAASVMQMALPVLMGAMQQNAASPQGAAGLLGALNGKHDGSLLNNLGTFFGGGVDQSDLQDGNGILNHVLGAKQPVVGNEIGKKAGLNSGQVLKILAIAAPLVMAYLGKQKRQANVNSPNDLGSLIGSALGGNQGNSNIIGAILGSPEGAKLAGNILGGMAGGNKGGAGLGNVLGNLFGKKG
ncbi:DUF937 domain-containing protein [Pararhodonellum marinum]|uniref:DUF937 domain-containing protein n=1 Tax=Pararhodonellum marinum TaxID=2755358 RepID=UPI0018903618|nr:DUF937 domain-containing protein [Pararhodonellum marinum]